MRANGVLTPAGSSATELMFTVGSETEMVTTRYLLAPAMKAGVVKLNVVPDAYTLPQPVLRVLQVLAPAVPSPVSTAAVQSYVMPLSARASPATPHTPSA